MAATLRVMIRKHTKLGGMGDRWRICEKCCKFEKICLVYHQSVEPFHEFCPGGLKYISDFTIIDIRNG